MTTIENIDRNSRLAYSTEGGRVREERVPTPPPAPGDGIVRVSRTRAGRKGKTVTLITGLPGGEADGVARELRRLCGSGGAAKGGVVEIQGDHRERIAAHLGARYRVKIAGG
jgi:translation initiation factor 1